MFEIKKLVFKNILEIEELIIPSKKIVCIVGESGSGKTTLIRHLNKLVSKDRGTIKYNNISIDDIDSVELRRKVVMLSQNGVVFEGNIRDNLLVGLKFSGKELVKDEVLLEALSIVSLNKKLDDETNKLSGGEKQRLAIARIIIMKPEVYLLDEPSSALDEDTEVLVIGKLIDYVKSKKKSLIMVTHSRNIAKNYAEYIIEIKKGKIIGIEEKSEK